MTIPSNAFSKNSKKYALPACKLKWYILGFICSAGQSVNYHRTVKCTHTHARTHTRTHARTHTRTYARTHARTHTHTHTHLLLPDTSRACWNIAHWSNGGIMVNLMQVKFFLTNCMWQQIWGKCALLWNRFQLIALHSPSIHIYMS